MSFKILFMGTPNFAVPILRALHNSKHKILEVYTQPPQKKNRGQQITSSPVHQYSNKINLSVRHPYTFNTQKEYEHIKKIKPDIVIVVAYGKIIPSKILSLENTLFINVHASLLPKWRGAAPIQRAIMNLDNETGVSIMKIVPKLDAGPVLINSKIKISKETTQDELRDEMSKLGSKLILDSLDLIDKGEEIFIDQNDKEATYAKKISKSELKINWNVEAKLVIAKINALNSNPGSWFELNGSRIKIIKAIEIKAKGLPGDILNKDFTIACSKNAIRILELKKEGKNTVKTSEYLKGNKLKVGSNINTNV
jgi:methionyl-tRNA formyltransferase